MVPRRHHMQITLNGKPETLDGPTRVSDLIARLDLEGRRLAVMINDEIVPRAQYAIREIADGDRVEIISMVGGG